MLLSLFELLELIRGNLSLIKMTNICEYENILGIDPGIATTGWGVIVKHGSELLLVDYGCVSTSAKLGFPERLNKIHKGLKRIIKKYKPNKVAIEELFFAKNVKTALKVGEARGVILLTARQSAVQVLEFTPLQVKQALVGYGRAEKSQIQKMVKLRLGLEEIPKPDDAADALSVAICCAQTNARIQ